MVILHSPAPPSTTDQGLRGISSSSPYELQSSYGEYKMKFCNYTMHKCSTQIKDDRICNIDGKCNPVYKAMVIPFTHSLCTHVSDYCDDNLEYLLNGLYNAGAISTDTKQIKQIDQRIEELNELKSKIKLINITTSAKKAHQSYLEEKARSKATEPKPAESAETEDKELEDEEATV